MSNSYISDGFSIRQLQQGIGTATFRRLIHHLLIGHRIFIKGSNEHLVSTLVKSLKVSLI